MKKTKNRASKTEPKTEPKTKSRLVVKTIGKVITDKELFSVRVCLESLAMALTENQHTWTIVQRALYEQAWAIVRKD